MGRILGPKCKRCRRLGMSICGSQKCALLKRKFPPGIHGPTKGYPRLTPYGEQLQEKQRARFMYHISEKQMSTYYKEASNSKELTGVALMQFLERRLDNVVYRLGLANTRRQARQLVSHCFITVNGKKLNIPSYRVKQGDIIGLRENKKSTKMYAQVKAAGANPQMPSWLHFEKNDFVAKIVSDPVKDDFREGLNEALIVEYYSR